MGSISLDEITSCNTLEFYNNCTDEYLECTATAYFEVMDLEITCDCMNLGDNSECDQMFEMIEALTDEDTHGHLWDETEDNKPLWALSHYDETVYTLYDHLEEAVDDETVTTELESNLEYMLENERARKFASAMTTDTQKMLDEFHVGLDLDPLQHAIDHAVDTSNFMDILDGFWPEGNREDANQIDQSHSHEPNWTPEDAVAETFDDLNIT